MNTYELTVVLDGKSATAKKKKFGDVLEKTMETFKGVIKETKDWGVKDLAYKIGKSETGQFMLYNLELEPNFAKALNEKLRTNADVLRFLVIKK